MAIFGVEIMHLAKFAPARVPSQRDNCAEEDSASFRFDKTDPGSRLAPRLFNHYILLEILGEGQFGVVWRAKDQQLERIVALKLPHLEDLDEHARMMLLREARAAATLEHPHIVRVHAIDQQEDQGERAIGCDVLVS